MTDTRNIPINVHGRVLRHISRGIYRTPAGALKELVSNAYDAGATKVTVTTGWPTIERIVITDNGIGIDTSKFERLVQHIGLSDKEAGSPFVVPGTQTKRLTIGHYGVGLLAVGQLAGVMTITSKVSGSLAGFTATVNFDQFERVSEADVDRSVIKDEREIERQESPSEKYFRIGSCELSEEKFAPADQERSFTRIILTEIRSFVAGHFSGDLPSQNPDWDKKHRYSANYSQLLRLLRDNDADFQLGLYPYERLVWEMAEYSPVRYPDIGPFQSSGELAHVARIARSPHFSLLIDGMEILKPFDEPFFSTEEDEEFQIFSWDGETFRKAATTLRSSGYLIYKTRIRPRVMRGLLVRENGVAVGLHDTTYLRYPFNEGQKFNQLTGEVFATGLSGSLNIDRNSFNETDDVYVSLCKWIHQFLQETVFPQIKKIQKRPTAKRRTINRRLLLGLLSQIAEGSDGPYNAVKYHKAGKAASLFKKSGRILLINQDHPDGSGSGAKQDKVLLAATLVLRGLVTPSQIAVVEELVKGAKRSGKRR